MSQGTVTTTILSQHELNRASGSREILEEEWGSTVINQVIYLSFVAVIGSIANLIVIFRGIRYRKDLKSFGCRRTEVMNNTNMFVISLAISNLGTSTFSIGVYIFPMFIPNVLVNEFTCRYIWPFRELFIAVSCYSFTFIAVGRYLILFQSFQNAKIFSSPAVSNIILWIFCYLLFAVPFSTAYKPIDFEGTLLCDIFWETSGAQRVHVTFLVLFNMLVPTFLVCACYLGIIRHLEKVRNVFAPNTAETLSDDDQTLAIAMTSHHAARISLLLLFSFLITYVPFGVVVMYIEYGNVEYFRGLETIHAVAFCLLHSGAVIDPLVIMLSSSEYRLKCEYPVELNHTDTHGSIPELIS